jgi:DNA polymerase
LKIAEGKTLISKLSIPRNPTKKDPRVRLQRDGTEVWASLDRYCGQDVIAEISLGNQVPELSDRELEVWKLDQRINARGIGVDLPLVEKSIQLLETARAQASPRLKELTGGKVDKVSQATRILNFVNNFPKVPYLKNLREDTLKDYLKVNGERLPKECKELLELRQELGGSATSKLFAMKYKVSSDSRVRGAFQFCGAQRTRRWAGRGVQTQNMPKGGPPLYKCSICGYITSTHGGRKVHCNVLMKNAEWGIDGIEKAMADINLHSFGELKEMWGNPAKVVSGCVRSHLTAAPGYEYISSDFAAIEAVVLACMAGERWIIDVFLGDGKLYEHTGAMVGGVPVNEIFKHKESHGTHHPLRRIGKVGTLASGYAGGIGAWRAFGAGKFMTNTEIREAVAAWRERSPAITSYWYETQDSAFAAVRNPGREIFVTNSDLLRIGVSFLKEGRALYCRLPNGERLTYLDAAITNMKKMSSAGWEIQKLCDEYQDVMSACIERGSDALVARKGEISKELFRLVAPKRESFYWKIYEQGFKLTGADRKTIEELFWEMRETLTYWGVGINGNWERQETYGGKLVENITQATARFILSEAMLRIDPIYPIVMHLHDEIVSEVPEGYGSIPHFEQLMSIMPGWARLPDGTPWPIRAAGGWRGKRYRK